MTTVGRPKTRPEDQCDWIITRFKYQGSTCGRPAGHRGQHNSREAMAHASVLSGVGGTERHKDWRHQLKAKFFEMYGDACTCCGSTEDLTLDHVLGDGQEHKEQLGYGQTNWAVYRDAVAEHQPKRYQPLCATCNNSKRDWNRCLLEHA